MSDENSAASVTAQYEQGSSLARENADLRQRLAALERANVVEGRFQGEAPRYRLNERGFYDDAFYEAGTTLEFTDYPNMTMVPLNEPARRRMEEHMAALVDGARRVAALKGREYVGLVTDRNVLIDTAMLDAKNGSAASVPMMVMPTAHDVPPAMPHTEEAKAAARRGPGRPRKVLSSEPPPPLRPGPDLGAPILAPAPSQPMEPAVVGRRVG
jgi:hypothetical protein